MSEIDIERLKVDESLWPEGATHYCEELTNPFLKCIAPTVKYWGGKAWIGYGCKYLAKNHIRNSIPRPTKQEWEGGLPPVGVECRLTLGFSEYDRVKITYMGDGVFCYLNMRTEMEYTGALYDATFRPLKHQHDRQREELALGIQNTAEQITEAAFPDSLANDLADAILSRYKLEEK